MTVLTTTPFGQRSLTAVLMKRAAEAQQNVSVDQIDKWSLFRDICTARAAFGVSDRTLTVLNALLSFHKGNTLSAEAQLVVFPSNRSLSERAHGMPESTLRRHLSALSNAGLIQRHDSPNGKRYVARRAGGGVMQAFGFDLRPLLVRAHDITMTAKAAREAAERLRALRREITLLKRDALKLSAFAQESGAGGDWTKYDVDLLDIHRRTRRVLDAEALEAVRDDLTTILSAIKAQLQTEEMSGSHGQNERQYHNSKEDSSVLEPCLEKAKAKRSPESKPTKEEEGQGAPNIPLGLVVKACPDILPYAPHGVRRWHDLVATVAHIRGMLGISADAWEASTRHMGPEVAAITVAAILQKVDSIKSPGGYLRALTKKAANEGFSPAPMIMALMRAS